MDVLQVSIKDHKEEFGKAPIILGIKWTDPNDLADAIDQAIEDGVPYNEVKMLSKEELFDYNNSKIVF